MSKPKILFVSQEIIPYTPENEMSTIGRILPQGTQESGKEIRTFMPRFGRINERRHQLHEVIRLSGMNLVVNDVDHPLIIKVASIQPARMQVYFIDNEEYFYRKAFLEDDDDVAFEDNDERAIFFAKGVLETVKKLGWSPDIIHCHGWMAGLVPTYLKTLYKNDPLYAGSKVIYSTYDIEPNGPVHADFHKKLAFDGIDEERTKLVEDPTYSNIHKLAIQDADALIVGHEGFDPNLVEFMEETGKPMLNDVSEEEVITKVNEFYDQILEENSVLAG